VVGGAAPVIVAALTVAFIGGLWFLAPLIRRDEE
jgi:hypothetical protein